ncbi:hypothetical protein KXQ82_17925 [Mucilaginibacter sp. HMF5004]|uniref:hypothetical protein n=1 Tax=Mucilaginibacter rivuli TaxID=2857527 RepID=UPI001C5DEA37|nr:hypothetical protein [Mucilaginibacter rivuli]MBW4891610.1 hypothetical protein [Mucilaginibacter rivuli]
METIKDQQELLLHISETIGKSKVLKLTDILYNRNFAISNLVPITFHPKREIAFRAAWLLENLILSNPAKYVNDIEQICEAFPKVTNKSCLRHYTKTIMHLTAPQADKLVKSKLCTIDMEQVIERCFELIIDKNSPVAVKAFSSQVLFNLRCRHNWIAEVLTDQIKIMMDGGEPAIKAKGRKLLSYLVCD